MLVSAGTKYAFLVETTENWGIQGLFSEVMKGGPPMESLRQAPCKHNYAKLLSIQPSTALCVPVYIKGAGHAQLLAHPLEGGLYGVGGYF